MDEIFQFAEKNVFIVVELVLDGCICPLYIRYYVKMIYYLYTGMDPFWNIEICNWGAYEAALKTNPILVKMFISGVVYSSWDWIVQVLNFSLLMRKLLCYWLFDGLMRLIHMLLNKLQCYEGKPLFEFCPFTYVQIGSSWFFASWSLLIFICCLILSFV